MSEFKSCPKCGKDMSAGYIREMNEFGTPKTIWASGKEPVIPWKNAPPRYWITAYRCEACGFLELYATEEQK